MLIYFWGLSLCVCICLWRQNQRGKHGTRRDFFFLKNHMKSEQGNVRDKSIHEWQLVQGWHSQEVCVFRVWVPSPPGCTPCQRDHNKLSSVQPGAKVPRWCRDHRKTETLTDAMPWKVPAPQTHKPEDNSIASCFPLDCTVCNKDTDSIYLSHSHAYALVLFTCLMVGVFQFRFSIILFHFMQPIYIILIRSRNISLRNSRSFQNVT